MLRDVTLHCVQLCPLGGVRAHVLVISGQSEIDSFAAISRRRRYLLPN